MNLNDIESKLLWRGLTAMSLATTLKVEEWVILIQSESGEDSKETARFDLIIRYVFATAPPEKRKAMIQEVETNKRHLADKARSVYELLLMEGREEGLEKGLERGREEIVVAMNKKGYSAEQIADITGLEIDKINLHLAKQSDIKD